MITPKDFMEFAEKEWGVSFVDVATGKKVLDVIKEKNIEKICNSCKWASNGDGKVVHKNDVVCTNGDSENCSEFISPKTSCKNWEAADEQD